MKAYEKVLVAAEKDPSILIDRSDLNKTLGSNPAYLLDVHGITKSDLIRLEREGLAMKTRYEVSVKQKRYISRETAEQNPGAHITGTHRVRWVLFRKASA